MWLDDNGIAHYGQKDMKFGERPGGRYAQLLGADLETREDVQHFGVKGMHWGVRRNSQTGGQVARAAKNPKPTNQDIINARIRNQTRIDRMNQLGLDHSMTMSKKGKKHIEEQMNQLVKDYNNDHKTAQMSTTGEKWVTGLMLGTVGLTAASLVLGAAGSHR